MAAKKGGGQGLDVKGQMPLKIRKSFVNVP